MEPIAPTLSNKYSHIRTAINWILGLSVALVLLVGRYQWTVAASNNSWRSYLMSGYLLVFTLPTTYYLSKFFLKRTIVVRLIFFFFAIWFVIPYQWMGLGQWYYNLGRPTFWRFDDPALPAPRLDWFPEALNDLWSVPYEGLFFISLMMLGVGIAIAYWQNRNTRYKGTEDGKLSSCTRKVVFWLGLYLLILLQTWLHLSMRSSTVYVAHFVLPTKEAFWYHGYLFPEAEGAVNLEYPAWRVLEENFMGVSPPASQRMMPRSFTFYLSSQWAYFFPPYYVYLTRNILMWFAACLAAYHLARIWGYSENVAVYFASLVSLGTGFIAFASEAAGYLPGYAIIILLLFLFESLVIKQSDGNEHEISEKYILFGCVLGLGSMVYDIFPLYLFFLGYGIYRRRSFLRLLICLGLALSIYFGFSLVQQYGPGIVLKPIAQPVLEQSVGNIQLLLTRPDYGQLYGVSVSFLRHYVGDLGNAFFILPILLAFVGLLLLRENSKVILILLLAVPSVLTIAILHWGGPNLASDNPRFVYVAYPMIYLLAAVCLSGIEALVMYRGQRGLARVAPWALLLLILVLDNVDVLGYPQTYFFFWENNYVFNK